MIKRAPDNVRYLRRFGEHILTRSFTARDPEETSALRVGRAARGFSSVQADQVKSNMTEL